MAAALFVDASRGAALVTASRGAVFVTASRGAVFVAAARGAAFVAAARGAALRETDLVFVVLRGDDFVFAVFRGADFLRDDAVFFEPLAVLRIDFFLEAVFPFFVELPAFFFFATPSSCARRRRKPDHTIGILSRGDGANTRDGGGRTERVAITPRPDGLLVLIQPLARGRAWRRRMAILGAAVAAAVLLACYRLGQAWEAGLRRLDFGDFPLPILILLSLTLLVAAPLCLLGLAALSFAEESIEVDAEGITIRRTAFEKTRIERIPLVDLDAWRETYWPLSPWWTWAVRRLAARSHGRLHPVAAAAGPKEKRRIGEALAAATGRPLVDDFGRRLR